MQEGFEIAFILRILEDSKLDCTMKHVDQASYTFDQQRVYDFLRQWTARIEVSVKDQLERVYFPIMPLCKYISTKKKDNIMLNADRESQQTKVNYLMAEVPSLMDEMLHNEFLLNVDYVKISPELLNNLKDFSTYISIGISLT